MGQAIMEARHERFIYYGPRQGAECECGELFYPESGKREDKERAFAIHRFLVGAA